MKPFGTPLTYEGALALSRRTRSTLNRWLAKNLIRTDYRWDHELGYSVLYLSETDVVEVRDKRWTRRRRTK